MCYKFNFHFGKNSPDGCELPLPENRVIQDECLTEYKVEKKRTQVSEYRFNGKKNLVKKQ